MHAILHPARAVTLSFLAVIVLGALLLMLPQARPGGAGAPLLVAFFTSVSAVCVTGLVTVDTGTYWSTFGQVIIMLLFQIGGFGMMTAATLLGLMVNRSARLRTRLMTQTETRSLGLGDVHSVARLVLYMTLACQSAIALVLTLRLGLGHGLAWRDAAWSGLFHAVSAFNNAGFSIHPDSLTRYAGDALILLPILLGFILGGIGFPVLHDLRMRLRDPRHWSLHTKLTLAGTLVLLLAGFVAVLLFEWGNPRTLGPLGAGEKILNSFFISAAARTSGFNTVDIAALTQETWALHYLLMFIGGGSASTAGGVKVATVAVLFLLVVAEARGHSDTEAFGRRVGASAQRQAVTVLVIGSILIVLGTLALLRMTDFPTDQIIFEVIAAFSTAGLSTGITAQLPVAGQLVLLLLMFFGRVGTITLATSLVMGERRMPYRYPEEHPIVG
ncbi:TrkH family potassium uptake protein [Massilia yuzhufengensis]|uniref:Trk system potassium uptake protein TrkH n=1 Tax=Massilia yuzhufengensis TaxID=1164594 RepID=A0A1I1UUY3_9BURK|nr:potassium transporter TrkG [Massilia yuzhufengensis]SFD71830.1 trk system potassium uptake protein TrkH [Massilia yuzhufengensis]